MASIRLHLAALENVYGWYNIFKCNVEKMKRSEV